MGNITSYCCKDGLESTEDIREEQSRIYSENGSNQQYGACVPPKSPNVYKIVLPKLLPIEIENYDFIDNQLDHSISTQTIYSNSRPSSPCDDFEGAGGDEQANNNSPDVLIQLSTETTAGSEKQEKRKNNKKTGKHQIKYDPRRPAVIKEEYCSEQFEHLRSLVFKHPDGQKRFRELLWSCIPWSAPGGKSGSTFLKTVNDQFILKEMSKLELQSFLSISNEYFKYIEDAYDENKPSLLSTIFGIYRIVYTSNQTQTSTEYYFMVMKNLFHKRNISQRFDLKGSVRNRLTDTSDPDNTEHVLMDENLRRIASDHPLFIHAKSKQILNECIENDSRFLASIAVMDYSLLVGVDKENQELVLGIIDYVRPFTWDKKIERVVKSVVSSELPTIVEPGLYRERFCEAMDKYFESVPDASYGQGC